MLGKVFANSHCAKCGSQNVSPWCILRGVVTALILIGCICFITIHEFRLYYVEHNLFVLDGGTRLVEAVTNLAQLVKDMQVEFNETAQVISDTSAMQVEAAETNRVFLDELEKLIVQEEAK